MKSVTKILMAIFVSLVSLVPLQVTHGKETSPSVEEVGSETQNLSLQEKMQVAGELPKTHPRILKDKDWFKHLKEWDGLDKRDKVMIVNVATIAALSIWGLVNWEYGSANLNYHNENWFGNDTKYGGADKLGHLWSTYAYADLLSYFYREWGYDKLKAAKLSALSSWIFMGIMEVFDGSSVDHGFSYEDFTMNTIGAFASYFLQLNPELDAKFDLRIEYKPKTLGVDFFTDYNSHKFIVALKMSGFEKIKKTFLRYFELQLGYYTRGFVQSPKDPDRTRNLFVGIGLNIPLVLKEAGYDKTSSFAEYMQIPFTNYELTTKNLNK